jgi:uncharacterized protein (UPF0264 family)
MTGMLASVNSLKEAALVLSANVDIIDLKQPALGALGALETDSVKKIVTWVDGRCPVSATIGDLPMRPKRVFSAVEAMADTGVDYIKIGFFPGNDWPGTIKKLTVLTQKNLDLIAVLFADSLADDNNQTLFTSMAALKEAGFKGIMLDTMNKTKGSLIQVMARRQIEQFVIQAKAYQLLCGLAGSLRLKDIPALLSCQPDYLGFRGALCIGHNRIAQLDRQSIFKIKQILEQRLERQYPLC